MEERSNGPFDVRPAGSKKTGHVFVNLEDALANAREKARAFGRAYEIVTSTFAHGTRTDTVRCTVR